MLLTSLRRHRGDERAGRLVGDVLKEVAAARCNAPLVSLGAGPGSSSRMWNT